MVLHTQSMQALYCICVVYCKPPLKAVHNRMFRAYIPIQFFFMHILVCLKGYEHNTREYEYHGGGGGGHLYEEQ